jgi:hypothetical protein
MPKHKVFGFQRSPRAEQPDQGAPDQPAKIAHRWNYQPIRGRQSAVLGFAVGTPSGTTLSDLPALNSAMTCLAIGYRERPKFKTRHASVPRKETPVHDQRCEPGWR